MAPFVTPPNALFARPPEVLVVDDEAVVLGLLAAALRHYGLGMRQADSGEEAVRVYQGHRDTIDVVLLDVQMPGLDGPQTLTALRVLNPAVRVLFMTGDAGRYSHDQLLALGADRVLDKPFERLTDVIDALRGAAARPASPAAAP